MRRIHFQHEHSYQGHKIVLQVSLIRPSGVEIDIEAILDTGASVSILSRGLVRALGLELGAGEPIELMVANGEIAQAFVHDVELNFLGQRVPIRAAICPDWSMKNYLGMQGFFDQMVIAFDHAQKRIYF